MKVITVPGDVQVGTNLMKFKEFVVSAVDGYTPAGKSVRMLRQVAKIVEVIEQSNGHISLEDADYDVIKAAMHFEDNLGDWNPAIGRKLLPFFDAIEKAEEVKK